MNLKERYWDFVAFRHEMGGGSLPVLTVKDDPKDWEKNPTTRIIRQKLNENFSILDIGAGDKRLKTILEKCL